MKTAPYNTGKVKIGDAVYLNKLVNRPYVEYDDDMLELQTYLIHPQAQINRAYWLSRIYAIFVAILATVIFFSV